MRLLKLILVTAALASPALASADTPTGAEFNGGSLTGVLVNDAFTQASFQNLSYRGQVCGTEHAELTCTAEVRATLYSDPARRCLSSTPESRLLWDSGAKPRNSLVESGPIDFPLEGCPGQILGAYVETQQTYDPEQEEGPWKLLVSGSSAPLFSIAIGKDPIRESEENVIAANPAAQPMPPAATPTLAISSNCRSLKIGDTQFVFVFRHLSCRTASNLATMAHLSSASPSGYVCKRRSRGERCWRRGRLEKYVEWRIPGAA